MTILNRDLVIVGAGMTGLMMATQLQKLGDQRSILLLDKGSSVGGRLATRRIDGGRADHGAQFFTVRDVRFEQYVRQWREEGLAYVWSQGWGDGSVQNTNADGYPRYAIDGGMNSLAKHLAAGLAQSPSIEIRTGTRLIALSQAGERWQLVDANGIVAQAAAVAVTAPVPQALTLLKAGDTELQTADREALERIEYAPCLCGLFHIQGDLHLPENGAIQRPNSPITWIADNQRKGISPDVKLVTVHMGAEMSRALYTESDDIIEPLLSESVRTLLDGDARIVTAQVKRWRYALPVVLYPEHTMQAGALPTLYFGGDAFGGPRVEGAALSGLSLADRYHEN